MAMSDSGDASVEETKPLKRPPRFNRPRKKDVVSEHLWCLMLTMIVMCGASLLVAVLVAAILFASQN